jgi:uncharacterized membrane protein
MTSSPQRLPESEYRWMAQVLRGGLVVSLVILVAALLAYALLHPDVSVAQAVTSNPILQFLQLPGLLSGLARGDPAAYLTLGLIALVVTPILRVLTGVYYFARGGERGMQAITLIVLVLLVFGLVYLGPLIR